MNITVDFNTESIGGLFRLLELAGFEAREDRYCNYIFLDKKKRLGDLRMKLSNVKSMVDDLTSDKADMVIARQYDLVELLGYQYEDQSQLRLTQRFETGSVPLIMEKRPDLDVCFDDGNQDELGKYRIGSTNPRYTEGWAEKYGADSFVLPISEAEIVRYGADIMKAKKLDVLIYQASKSIPKQLGLKFDQIVANVGLSMCSQRGKSLSAEAISLTERLVIAESDAARQGGKENAYASYFPVSSYQARFG